MFSVRFRGDNGNVHVIYIDNPPAGLRALDGARSQLGPQIARVLEPLGCYRYEIQCDVTEAQARKACSASGAFGYAFGVSVVVPRASLNRYVLVNWRLRSESDNRAMCEYAVDTERLINDWISAGAPLEWTPANSEPSASPEEAEEAEDETDN